MHVFTREGVVHFNPPAQSLSREQVSPNWAPLMTVQSEFWHTPVTHSLASEQPTASVLLASHRRDSLQNEERPHSTSEEQVYPGAVEAVQVLERQ